MPSPGEPGHEYTADGLAHNACGTPSSNATDHREQLTKLIHKLSAHDYGDGWARIDRDRITDKPGRAPISLVTWGSSWGAVQEAATRLRDQGLQVQTIGLRLLAPLQHTKLTSAIAGTQVLVVEINATGQLFRYLNAERALPSTAGSFARPGPLPLRPSEVVAQVQQLINEQPTTVSSSAKTTDPPAATASAIGGS